MRSVDDAIGFLAQDPMHATAQAKRHAGQLPAAAEEFIESTLFYKKDDSIHKVKSIWFSCCKQSRNLFAKTILAQEPMHATAQAKRHAGQLPAAAEEFIESTLLFYKKDDSIHKV